MKLNRKILLVTIGVLFVSLLAGSVANILDFRKNYTEALIAGSYGVGQSLNSVVTELLDLGLPLDSLSGMDKKMQQLVQNNLHISYAGIGDVGGKLLYHSDGALVGRVFSDAVTKASIAATQPLTQTYRRFDGYEYYDVALPIFDSRKTHVGAIRLGFRTEVVDAKVRDAIAHVAINVTLTFLVIAFLLNVLLSRLVSQPVIALSDQARDIAQGRFDTPTAAARNDEIGQLADSLNAMASTIASQIEALRRSRHELEQQVAARTSELETANDDLTEKNRALVQTIAEREEAQAEILRSNTELEQFSYSISHDMRQPLRMISSYLQLLEMSLAETLDADKREYLRFATDGAKRLDQMLVALLEYSRIGRKGEPTAWAQSRTILDEALLFLQPAIVEARADVRIEGEWPRVCVSHDEMSRLLQNLIGNALKFRVAGRTPAITVTSETRAHEWRVCVADNGAGINPAQLGRLFQVFQRLHSRATYEGPGIGLALCRKIAEHHGGRIWAKSPGEDRGSTFCVELPLESRESDPPNSAAGPD